MPHHADRRQHIRRPVNHPVKLLCEQSPGRYLSGRTENVSAGGALLRIIGGTAPCPGQTVHLGIASRPGQAVLNAGDMTPATVIRSNRDGAHHRVAVRCISP